MKTWHGCSLHEVLTKLLKEFHSMQNSDYYGNLNEKLKPPGPKLRNLMCLEDLKFLQITFLWLLLVLPLGLDI